MHTRRNFLKRCSIGLGTLFLGKTDATAAISPDTPSDKIVNDKARAARDVASALAALEVSAPGPGTRVLLDVPEIVDQNENISIKVKSAIPKTDWIAVLIDKNKFPFVGQFNLAGAKTAEIEVKIKLMQTSTVIAVVRADGKYYRVDKEVKVATPS